jgi:hypothetical protein
MRWIYFLNSFLKIPIELSGKEMTIQKGDSIVFEQAMITGFILDPDGTKIPIIYRYKVPSNALQAGDKFQISWNLNIEEEKK